MDITLNKTEKVLTSCYAIQQSPNSKLFYSRKGTWSTYDDVLRFSNRAAAHARLASVLEKASNESEAIVVRLIEKEKTYPVQSACWLIKSDNDRYWDGFGWGSLKRAKRFYRVDEAAEQIVEYSTFDPLDKLQIEYVTPFQKKYIVTEILSEV